MKPGPRPRKALILAAGYGTRMGVLSRDMPKALLPMWNRPLLARAVDLLGAWGVRDIVINAHHSTAQIIDATLSLRTQTTARLTVSHEPDILGTGGAVAKAAWFFDDGPFWIINADLVADLDPAPLIDALRNRRAIAALWMHPSRGPRSVLVRKGTVQDFAAGKQGTHTFCGLHLVRPEIVRYLPDQGFASIIDAYRAALKAGHRVAGVEAPDCYWADVGTPERYLKAHVETAARWSKGSKPDVCIANTARVGRGATLSNSVVMEGAIIAPESHVRHAIIGRHVQIRDTTEGLAVRADLALASDEHDAFVKLGWDIETGTFNAFPPRGSERFFARVYDASHSAILIRYNPSRTENQYYADQARFLAGCHWPVPKVLANAPDAHWTIMEDVGDMSLQSLIQSKPNQSESLYRRVLEEVARLHGSVTRRARRSKRLPLMPAFGPAVYRYERDLFIDHYLRRHLNASAQTVVAAEGALRRIARLLAKQAHVLVHRDLQSSNIYWVNGKPCFIDFQGMRWGPPAYDIASLLYDPYVALPAMLRARLLAYYRAQPGAASFSDDDFRHAAIQRLCQAIGAYARLSAQPGCAHFLSHIPQALTLLQKADECGELYPLIR